jgi:hypothetical protein
MISEEKRRDFTYQLCREGLELLGIYVEGGEGANIRMNEQKKVR